MASIPMTSINNGDTKSAVLRASTARRRPRIAYILACSHSGSTLLAMLLGAHADAITVGELTGARIDDPDKYLCSCGKVLNDCAFWARVRETMAQKGLNYAPNRAGTDIRETSDAVIRRLLSPLHRRRLLESVRDAALFIYPPWRRHLSRVQQRNARLVETICELSGAKVVVDSGKIGLRLKYLLRNDAFDVRIIRLIRDGRGVALTVTDEGRFADATNPKLRGGGFGTASWCRNRPISFGANVWRRSNEEAECIISQLNRSQWMEMRYEQLCAAPAESLRTICGFLELDPERVVLNFRGVEHHVIGNGMRLNDTAEIRLDERWREFLSEEDRGVFDSIAGDLNRRYGYA